MTTFQQIKLGLKSYNKAFSFIFKNKLGWTFLVPIALNIILFAVAQNYIIELIDYIKGFVEGWSLIKDSEFWSGAVSVVAGFFIEILFFIAFAYLGGYIVLIIMSPLLSYISEKTEKVLSGNDYEFNLGHLIKDTMRGIVMAIRNMFIELGFLILALIVGLIPVIGWFGAIFLFFISAYFYGFSFIDYYNERQRLKIKESATLVKKYKGIAISNGGVFALSLLIPFCGSYLALFVAIISVVAATIAMTEANAYED
ncbi:MAG: EI24 domain-containing protein [Bacteroidota bacterium]